MRTKSCEQTDTENMSGQPTPNVIKIKLRARQARVELTW